MRNAMPLRMIRRELRGDLPLLCCLVVVVATLTALCALGPLLAARQEDRALTRRVATAQTDGPLVTVGAQLLTAPAGQATPLPQVLAVAGGALLGDADRPLDRMLTVTRSAADYPAADLPGFRPDAPGADSAQLSVSYLSDGLSHVRLLRGVAPAAHTPPGSPAQIAVSQTTARLLGLRVGQRLTARYTLATQTTVATFAVSGIFTRAPGGEDFWKGRRSLDVPLEYASTDSAGRQLSAQALLGADGPALLEAAGVPEPALSWQLHVDLGPAAVRASASLPPALHSYLTQVNQLQCSGNDANGNPVCVADDRATTIYQGTDGLTPLLADFAAQDRRARALSSYAEAALAAIALATVVVTVRLLLARRGPQLRLQRARGAGAGTLVLLRGAAAAVVVTGAGLLGWWVGSVCAPWDTSGQDRPAQAVAVGAAAVLALPVQTWLSVREPRRPGRTAPKAAGRRIVAEATVLLLAVAAVAALRARGASGGAGGPDPQLTATPVLVSVAVVALLLRAYPLVLRGLARATRRGPGLVAFVGLRCAADAAPTTGLALYVLVLTLGTAVFGDLVTGSAPAGGAQGPAGLVSGSYAVCTTVGAAFCLLALVLELVLTARDRGRTVAMLRTLGLGGPPVLALQLLQTLPLALAAATGGAVLGLVEPQVLGPALDLRALTGAAAAGHADHTRVAGLALVAALLVLAVAAAETLTLRRRRLHAVLRLGER